MGAGESHDAVASAIQPYTNWEREQCDDLIKKYKGDPDMTFGIDEKACTRLLGGDNDQAKALITLFGGGEPHINALELLCAIAVYSKGDKEAIIKSLFSAFDFNDKNNISSAELIIMFISTLRAMICAIKDKAAGDDGPRDEDIEKLVDAKFKEDEEIPLSAFASFLEKVFFNKNGKGLTDVMNLSYALCQQFGLDTPSPSVPVEAPTAEVTEKGPEPAVEEETPKTEEAPKEEAPKEEAPTEEAPKEEGGEEAPKEEAPKEEGGEEAPKEEAPTEEAPKEEAPKEEAPKEEGGEEAPKEEAPTEEAPKEEGGEEAPKEEGGEEAPKEEAPTEEAPKEEGGDEAPKEEAPTEEAPKEEGGEEAPKEEAPKEEAPTEEAPKEEAPKEEAPKEEAPKEEAPTEEAPKEEAPKE